ncbi:MAG: hypothetical protein A2284_01875 [Deltaproteobacteria bacterium RIFOXYA12_FULL_61_11]|nr:MAG: hypothetical protein A2284_01875 [Deltaproteobacteria bacterium RIFOXYA12_FULL_61_11]
MDQLNHDYYLDCDFATRVIHAGEHFGEFGAHSHNSPIYQTSTFSFKSAKHGSDVFSGREEGYMYTRLGNPTVKVLEAKMNAIEGREVKLRSPETRVSSLVFSSGMAAASAAIMACAKAGDTVLIDEALYGCTTHFCCEVLPQYGVTSIELDTSDLGAVEAALGRYPKARALLFETPANPTMKITDITAVSRLAHRVNPELCVIVDNTFATPYLQNPLALGADLVFHSTTKYLCGHGTVVGGVVTTNNDRIKDRLYILIKDLGHSPSPFDTWLVNQGLKTLALRMERHCSNAMTLATFLEKHPKVSVVRYPGLEHFPYHRLAKEQMRGFGGMIAFDLKGGYDAGVRLMDNVRLFTLAVSLGCVDSLIQHPASMTHAVVPKDKREKAGITDGLVRISVGVEHVDDLITDLTQALAKV